MSMLMDGLKECGEYCLVVYAFAAGAIIGSVITVMDLIYG